MKWPPIPLPTPLSKQKRKVLKIILTYPKVIGRPGITENLLQMLLQYVLYNKKVKK